MRVGEIDIGLMVNQVIEVCKHELELDQVPEITLVDKAADIGHTAFGVFDGTIKVVIGGRHPMDVMRTLVHELVHWKQKLAGEELDGSDGSSTENAANAISGIVMRRFGRSNPHYFSL